MSIISIIICIEGESDNNCCVVTILLLLGAGTALFGFIQVCEAYAPPTAEYFRNA